MLLGSAVFGQHCIQRRKVVNMYHNTLLGRKQSVIAKRLRNMFRSDLQYSETPPGLGQ
jgi:hypothetical protein